MSYRTARPVSAGGAIVRSQDGRVQVCLIAHRSGGRLVWGLPKGHIEAGEAPEATAIREIREETGLSGEPLSSLGSIAYQFTIKEEQTHYAKTVHFFLLRYVLGELQPQDTEVDDAAWVDLSEALTRISYENERKILLKAQTILQAIPLAPAS